MATREARLHQIPVAEQHRVGEHAEERCADDRHHFRFIVSPEDAPEMADLKGYARELVGQMEKDLGIKLDWVAVDHWNTQHPHVHIIVRGGRVTLEGDAKSLTREQISAAYFGV